MTVYPQVFCKKNMKTFKAIGLCQGSEGSKWSRSPLLLLASWSRNERDGVHTAVTGESIVLTMEPLNLWTELTETWKTSKPCAFCLWFPSWTPGSSSFSGLQYSGRYFTRLSQDLWSTETGAAVPGRLTWNPLCEGFACSGKLKIQHTFRQRTVVGKALQLKSLKNTSRGELERCISPEEHLLFFQRTGVYFPAPISGASQPL